jgi:hypothetical protein
VQIFAHVESFNERDLAKKQEATGKYIIAGQNQ